MPAITTPFRADLSIDDAEINNLATAKPELVRKLDLLIEKHLTDTNAVTPKPNPDFDPKRFEPEKIGIRPERKTKNRKRRKS